MLRGGPSRDNPSISTGLISGQVADSTLGTGQEQGQCGRQGCGVEGQSLPGKRPLESRVSRGTGPVRPRSGGRRDWEAVEPAAAPGRWALGLSAQKRSSG